LLVTIEQKADLTGIIARAHAHREHILPRLIGAANGGCLADDDHALAIVAGVEGGLIVVQRSRQFRRGGLNRITSADRLIASQPTCRQQQTRQIHGSLPRQKVCDGG
jgi:hypothetical protein